MKIFCDLDGTIIDVSARHYRVYCEMVMEFDGTPINKSKYWNLKRNKIKWSELLPVSQIAPENESRFLQGFIKKIEHPDYLKLDTVFPGAMDAIEKLANYGECYLVTLRRNRENVLEEVAHLDLTKHFTGILTGHSESDGHDIKVSLIREKLERETGIIIGDTEADALAGQELGLKTIAVTSGIRSKEFLERLKPDLIVSNIIQVPELLGIG